MPKIVAQDLWHLVPTLVYFVVGLLLFGFSVWVMEKVAPFSIRKEIEEDQNDALGILMGSTLVSLAILLAAVMR